MGYIIELESDGDDWTEEASKEQRQLDCSWSRSLIMTPNSRETTNETTAKNGQHTKMPSENTKIKVSRWKKSPAAREDDNKNYH